MPYYCIECGLIHNNHETCTEAILRLSDPDPPVIIKAFGGNRSKNLESIADEIDRMLEGLWSPEKGHKIHGYMEQLRIIAEELKCTGE